MMEETQIDTAITYRYLVYHVFLFFKAYSTGRVDTVRISISSQSQTMNIVVATKGPIKSNLFFVLFVCGNKMSEHSKVPLTNNKKRHGQCLLSATIFIFVHGALDAFACGLCVRQLLILLSIGSDCDRKVTATAATMTTFHRRMHLLVWPPQYYRSNGEERRRRTSKLQSTIQNPFYDKLVVSVPSQPRALETLK